MQWEIKNCLRVFSSRYWVIKRSRCVTNYYSCGGPQIGERLKSKNISTQFVEGLRVTDKETIKVVEEVLSKDINSEIVESISASGGKAIGVSGNDNLVTATKLNVEIKDNDSNIEKIVLKQFKCLKTILLYL